MVIKYLLSIYFQFINLSNMMNTYNVFTTVGVEREIAYLWWSNNSEIEQKATWLLIVGFKVR